MVAPHELHTGDLAHNPGMCLDWESNLQPFSVQAYTQSTELYQPGLMSFFLRVLFYPVFLVVFSKKVHQDISSAILPEMEDFRIYVFSKNSCPS